MNWDHPLTDKFFAEYRTSHRAPSNYYMSETTETHSLYKGAMDVISFVFKADKYCRVVKFWGYDIRAELRLSRSEARQLYALAIQDGFTLKK